MKRTKGGKLSEQQEKFIAGVRKQEYAAFLCYGFEEAKEVILRYLNNEL